MLHNRFVPLCEYLMFTDSNTTNFYTDNEYIHNNLQFA